MECKLYWITIRNEIRFALRDYYYNYAVGSGVSTSLSGSAAKLAGHKLQIIYTDFQRRVDNRLTYLGK
jgi:hypothetical protein